MKNYGGVLSTKHVPFAVCMKETDLIILFYEMYVKVHLTLYRPGQALNASRNFRQSAHVGGKAVSLTHRPAFTTPANIPGILCDFRLPPRSRREPRSSGL